MLSLEVVHQRRRAKHFAICLYLQSTMPLAPPLNFPRWLSENSLKLQPPVNNFCLYSGQDYVVMVVGGPNERNDYHVNETEVRLPQYQQEG